MSKTFNSLTYSLRTETNKVFDRDSKSKSLPNCIIVIKDPHDPNKLNVFDCEEVYLFELSFIKLNHYKGAYDGYKFDLEIVDNTLVFKWWTL